MPSKLKYYKRRLGAWLAFRKQYRLWKSIVPVPPQGMPANNGKRLTIVPCDPWSVGGSRGDEAMITAVIQRYRKLHPSAPITIITEGEEGNRYVEKLPYPGIEPLPVWNGGNPIKKIYDAVIGQHPACVVLLGADCMDGFYSPFISLTLLALHDLFSRTEGIKSRLTGFSFIGKPYLPLRKAFNNTATETRLRLRDTVSLERFNKFTGKKAELVADIAFMLEADYDFDGYTELKKWITARRADGTERIIGFNFHPMLRKYRNDSETENDAHTLAQNMAILMRQDSHISFVLIPHDDRPRYTDNIMLGKIAAELGNEGFGERIYYTPEVYRATQIKALCSLIDGLISSRMHLAIAALGQGKSVMTAEYRGKFEGLLKHFGLPEYCLLRPEEFISDKFTEHADEYIRHLPELTRQVEKGIKKVEQLAEKNLS